MHTKASNHIRELVQAALTALRDSAGVEGRLLAEPDTTPGVHSDAVVELQMDGHPFRFFVMSKDVVDRHILLAQAKEHIDRWGKPGLLAANSLSPALAQRCRRLGLQFIDTAGNAHLRAPGLYVYVCGQKPIATNTVYGSSRGIGRPTALRIIFALLCHPELMGTTYRDIVDATGVALGAVGRTLDDLRQRGFITAQDATHGRRLLEPQRLLDEWVALYPTSLRPKLNPKRFRASTSDWWQDVQLPSETAWWGGDVAADRMLGTLKPATQTIYIAPPARAVFQKRLIAAYRLRPDPSGPVELLDAFWNFRPTEAAPDLVPAILTYADLMANLEPRSHEIARSIREEVIHFAHRPA